MTSLIILALAGILLLFLGLGPKKRLFAPAGMITLLLAGWFQVSGTWQDSSLLEGMMSIDAFSRNFGSVMIFLTFLIFLLGIEYYEAMERHVAENFSLMLFSLFGAIIMVSFTNLIMLFLGIEILSIPLYILAGSKKKSYRSNEASFKYFVMGSFASAIMLFGIALLYGVTASFDLSHIRSHALDISHYQPMYVTGLLLVIVGMGFKVAAAPFHFWSPDVYEGSPTLVTAFMATVVKTAGIAAFWRLFDLAFFPLPSTITWVLWIITFLTLAIGNLSALWQSSFKRLLAYSGIANTGFLMLALLSADPGTPGTLLYYSLTYSLATIIAFSVFFTVKKFSHGSEQTEIFSGLYQHNPFLAVILTISLLSLAGIPPLAGFLAKYSVFLQAIRQDFLIISIIAILMTLVAIYYYFSVLRFVFAHQAEKKSLHYPPTSVTVSLICAALLLLLGFFPGWVL